jgi:hypothetical protein
MTRSHPCKLVCVSWSWHSGSLQAIPFLFLVRCKCVKGPRAQSMLYETPQSVYSHEDGCVHGLLQSCVSVVLVTNCGLLAQRKMIITHTYAL